MGRRMKDQLAEVDLDGETHYVLKEDLDDLRATKPTKAVRSCPATMPG